LKNEFWKEISAKREKINRKERRERKKRIYKNYFSHCTLSALGCLQTTFQIGMLIKTLEFLKKSARYIFASLRFLCVLCG